MRKAIAVAIATITVLASAATAEDPVCFADPILKAAVEDALWISDPTPTDMLGMLTLTVNSRGIKSLTGLEYAANLTLLRFHCNQITDITAVSSLVNLRKLVLNNNQISDITPLSNLTALEHLDMHDNGLISDITPLSGLTALQTVVLRGNQISNLASLSRLTSLQSLHLERNQISNIAALAGLTTLTRLDLRDNPLNDDAYDIYIPQILANNHDIFLSHPANPSRFVISSTAGGSVVDPGEGEFLLTDASYIFIEARADPYFVFVGFSGSCCTTQNPVQLAVDQDHQIHAAFSSILETLYVDDDSPNDPGPGDAAVSDLLENGTRTRPFDSIQEAIEVAAQGASIIVRPGTYRENISLMGKCIDVIGIDPNDPNSVGYPVIDGMDNGPVVSFTHGEDPNCMLAGFILSGGQGQPASAVVCTNSSPTIANCLIVGNRVAKTEGAVVHCHNSQTVFRNCTIADNDPGEWGAGLRLVDSNVALLNSILWENGSDQIVLSGTSELTVCYTNLMGGWPGLGNTDADPSFARRGYWAAPNIGLEPSAGDAVWIAGDYHLKSQAGRWDRETQTWVLDEVTSPCIDAGDPLEAIGQKPVLNGDVINMGAYGGTAAASHSY